MYFRRFYLGCLAQASYMIGSEGVAAVIDPRRDVEVYLAEAAAQGLTIRHVIETHLHADFVSGHRELAAATGATIHVSREAHAAYPHDPVGEGSEIALGGGGVFLRVLDTPGHTPDSICLLVIDPAKGEDPVAVLTGDTLFIGDVGRPDLAGAARVPRDQAGDLYDSLHVKLLSLADSVVVHPGHGAGSMCGRNLSQNASSTIGEQRRMNYALAPMSRETFIEMMTTDLPEVPAYFGRDVQLNQAGPSLLCELAPVPELSSDKVAGLRGVGVLVVLDTRPSAAFAAGHVPGSIHIGLDGQFASWAGTVIPASASIVLVTDGYDGVSEARTRLARVGLENVVGYLAYGIAGWVGSGHPIAQTEQISVQELAERLSEGSCRVVDVRRPAEWNAGHIARALALPLADLVTSGPGPWAESPVAVICASGYRSSIAASLLERGGLSRISNIVGGMAAWNAAGLAVTTA